MILSSPFHTIAHQPFNEPKARKKHPLDILPSRNIIIRCFYIYLFYIACPLLTFASFVKNTVKVAYYGPETNIVNTVVAQYQSKTRNETSVRPRSPFQLLTSSSSGRTIKTLSYTKNIRRTLY